MEQITEKLVGPITFSVPTALHGLVDGTVIATDTLNMHGLITGDLVVQEGVTAVVHGMVNGAVINEGGAVQIYGMVNSVRGSPPCEIMPGAKVG